ncbi:MAG: ATP-binding protein, partial [Actinobacteria bacterium]|nr:ATP-binding protein [Actinomycetota bacterium]
MNNQKKVTVREKEFRLECDVLGAEQLETGRIGGAFETSVAFADLVGFTRLGGRVAPEDLGAVARKLAAAGDWGDCARLLAEHFARHGAGPFGRYRAFRWGGDGLRAVPRPDPITLSGLVGYEREREPLLRNTERFLAGLPAHHALLYGLPGTGKSSTVKAV